MTVNHLVTGSNPVSGAIHSQPPKIGTFNEFNSLKDEFFTTFLQQKYDYLHYITTNTEYLQLINNRYYFVIRIGKKIVKTTLKTTNLKYSNIIKIKLLKWLKTMDINLNTNLQIGFLVEENDDDKESQRIIKKLEQVLLKEKQKTNKISTISTKTEYDKNFETIEEVFKSFIKYSRKVKRVKENTFKEYETSFKWLLLDYKKTSKVYELENIDKWIEYRDLLTTLPNNFFRRYKDGLDLDDIVYIILEENDENDKETVLLNSKTINKHFITYNQFLNYLVLFKKIKSNPIDKLPQLNTIENPHNSFTEDEINKLLKDTKDREIKDFFNVLLHTGMRLSSVLNIRKENIDLELKTLDIIDDKTISGVRKIIIHNKIFNILNDYVKSDKEHIFFETNGKDLVQKKINRHIKKILEEHKTIHSFRKNFTQKLFNICDDINLRKYIIGHSQLRDITFTTYNQEKINLDKLGKVINQISYINIKSIDIIEDEDIEFC